MYRNASYTSKFRLPIANAVDLFAETNIDGALIEGASLDATEFTAIYTAAHRAVQKAIAAST
ncbi:hypothetical protein FAZ69_03220 [Trinickia terrae]|uniref:Uncharacterized protein n=1 Tax=Trinickia terrae TaxID=2571161 RepID=A0A4U1IEA6_9BURK|nr:hypothetical protein FAZ69_03220 [Trinickia terrae]